MKKILVLSDSHRRRIILEEIFEQENDADIIVFLGDGLEDIEECRYVIPNLRGKDIRMVSGNCDWSSMESSSIMLSEYNKKILCTHGHLFGVKRGLDDLALAAKNKGCDAVLFGHTHVPVFTERHGIKLFNPGAVEDGRYGVIMIEGGGMSFSHLNLR